MGVTPESEMIPSSESNQSSMDHGTHIFVTKLQMLLSNNHSKSALEMIGQSSPFRLVIFLAAKEKNNVFFQFLGA